MSTNIGTRVVWRLAGCAVPPGPAPPVRMFPPLRAALAGTTTRLPLPGYNVSPASLWRAEYWGPFSRSELLFIFLIWAGYSPDKHRRHRPAGRIGKFAFGDRTIPIHARTLGPDEHNPNAMGMYYGTVQSAVLHTNETPLSKNPHLEPRFPDGAVGVQPRHLDLGSMV